jgi:hypothetical protein
MATVYQQLGFDAHVLGGLKWADTSWRDLPEGQALPEPTGVFQRIEMPVDEAAEAAKKQVECRV